MTFKFLENEFTTVEILYYLNKAYGRQINGKPFSIETVNNWIRIKHFPAAYGGHKIVSAKFYPQVRITTIIIHGLRRMDAEDIIGSFDELYSSNVKVGIIEKIKLRPRKQRTKLYYNILEAAGKQYTKQTLPQATLPLYWKEAGIKRNQIINGSRTCR